MNALKVTEKGYDGEFLPFSNNGKDVLEILSNFSFKTESIPA